MRNTLLSIIDASARRQGLGPNPHVAELRALFAAACRFGLTQAERDEWQARFDEAIAAVEAQLVASDAEAARARGNRRRFAERALTALPARAAKPETAEPAV